MNKSSNQKLILLTVLQEVFKNLWVVVALSLSLSFLGYIAADLSFQPTYTSSTTFVVSRKGATDLAYANMTKTSNMIDTFRSVMNSQVLQKRVYEVMGTGTFPGTISVNVVPETNLMTMSVTADRPELAFHALKGLISVYPEVGAKVLGEVIMDTFEKPTYPAHPDREFAGLTIMGDIFLVSFCLLACLFGVVSYLRDTVKTDSEVHSKLDTSLFGVLYHERQYKNLWAFLRRRPKLMRLNDPSVSFLYEETVKKLSTRLLYKLKSGDAKVVLITSTVSGEGVSTVAMNLAQDISHRGKSVLLIEGDLKDPGLAETMHLGRSIPIPSWGQQLKAGNDLDTLIFQPPHYSFDALLNATPQPQPADLMSYPQISRWIAHWRSRYDVILIDAPPVRRRSDTEVLARCADLSLLVVRANTAQTKFINDSIDMLEGYGSGLLGCLCNDALRERGFVAQGHGYGYGYGYGGYGGYGEYGSYGHYKK